VNENLIDEDAAEPIPDSNTHMELIGTFQRGERFLKDGLPVLVLRGSYFEMGQQYGYLAAKEVTGLLGVFDALAQQESSGMLGSSVQHRIRRWLGQMFEKHFPASANQMIEGIVSGAGLRGVVLERHDIAFLNSLIDIAGVGSTDLSMSADGFGSLGALIDLLRREIGAGWIEQNCNTFAAWGTRTSEGKTFQTRNTDITVGLGLERFPMLYMAFPEQEAMPLVPYVSAGFAGQIGVSTGMNAYGVALGQVWAFSRAKAIGAPWSLLMIDVMSRAKTATSAAELLTTVSSSPHTYGNNFVFADATGDGIALELNPLASDTFRAADPRELEQGRMSDGRIWAVPLQDAIVRADFSMSKTIRSHQTSARGPDGYPPHAGSYRDRYAGQIRRILGYESMNRDIGPREAMVISRATADRRAGNIQLAVYANSDRKLWVSYATNNDGQLRQAFQNAFVLIPFDQMLESMDAKNLED
jgi:hypothetical protein